MATKQFRQSTRPFQVMVDQVFGWLTVESYHGHKFGISHWVCRCECGRTTIAQRNNLISGNTWKCGRRCPKDYTERFWGRVIKADGDLCWEWTGAIDKQTGYGRFGARSEVHSTHRYSWELHFGPIPDRLYVLHHCDNRPCVRPDHLFLGTHADNVRDMVNKGRAPLQINPDPVQGEKNPFAKLTDAKVIEIRARYSDHKVSCRKIAELYGVAPSNIQMILSGQSWRHLLPSEGRSDGRQG